MTFYSEMLRLLGYLVGFLVFVALNAAYLVWVERKVAGHIQPVSYTHLTLPTN